jgi:hypothetical protein
MNIEGLIEKAKGLGLTYLRVADPPPIAISAWCPATKRR